MLNFSASIIVEVARCFLSSPQGSEGHNTNLHAVPNDAVLCLSLCGMDGVCMYVCIRESEREFALHNGLADAFFSSQMGYISIPSSAVFLIK